MKAFLRPIAFLAIGLTHWGLFAQDLDIPEGMGAGVYAEIRTGKGVMVLELEHERAPKTSFNFVGLAEGTIGWIDPTSREYVEKPYFDGLTFHRVKDEFMIQAGCPLGSGTGGPGYVFEDEFRPDLKHDALGILSMANSGPNTNGGQFFVTLTPQPGLDGKHTVFGRLFQGEKVLRDIGMVPTGARDKPVADVVIEKILIHRVGNEASSFATAESLAELREENRKDVPEPTGKLDPARVPGAEKLDLPEKWDSQFLLIQYRGAPRAFWDVYHDKESAAEVAGKIVALARTEDADFEKIIEQYTDNRRQFTTTFRKNMKLPEFMDPVQRLEVGQVSDPVETPLGFYVFKRVKREVVSARHILITFAGKERDRTKRTREEAQKIASEVLEKARAGEDFGALAMQYSDGPTRNRGGDLGEFARGQMAPPFSKAVFALEVNGVSDIVETQYGFHIIQRYR